MNTIENIKTDVFNITIKDNMYYIIEIYDTKPFTPSDLKNMVKKQMEMGGKKLPVLVICNKFALTDVEFLSYLSKNANNPYSKVDAFVIHSVAQKILGNFYLKVISPERPTKLFTRKKKAMEWLSNYIS